VSHGTRVAEAANTTDPDRIEALVTDPSVEVRRSLMGRQAGSLPGWAVTALARDRDRAIRRGIALRHPLTGPVAARLATDPATAVRSALARRTDIDPALVVALAFDPDPTVRAVAVLNRLLPHNDFDRLVEQELSVAVWVSMVARRATTPETVRLLLERSHEPRLWEMAVRRLDLAADLVARAARSADSGVRTFVAERDDLDSATVELLLADDKSPVRQSLIRGGSPIPASALRSTLHGDPDEDVRAAALRRLQDHHDSLDLLGQRLSMDSRRRLAELIGPDDPAIPLLAKDRNRRVREVIARRTGHGNIDPSVIADLSADRSFLVRRELARHVPMDADPQVLVDLATDPRDEVAEALADRRGLPDVAVVVLVAAGRTR
jgi:hypothetical protein